MYFLATHNSLLRIWYARADTLCEARKYTFWFLRGVEGAESVFRRLEKLILPYLASSFLINLYVFPHLIMPK